MSPSHEVAKRHFFTIVGGNFKRAPRFRILRGTRAVTADKPIFSMDFISPMNSANDNPLLRLTGLPAFDAIRPEHVVPAVRQRLAEAANRVAEIEQSATPTWEGTMAPLDELNRTFEYCWQPVTHLFGVKNSSELREAYETVLPEVVAFGLRVRQSRPLFEAIKALRAGDRWDNLSPTRQRIVEKKLLDAELAGIGLPDEQRKRFNEIAEQLSNLGAKFSNNVLDANKAFALVVTDANDAAGMPTSLLRLAASSYNEQKPADKPEADAQSGPWRFTLDIPSYGPFMEHCRNRAHRETMYRAFISRAASEPHDNAPILRQILTLRQEQAELLGYRNYAEVSLATKMAPSLDAVLTMLEQLRVASWPHADQDLADLQEIAVRNGHLESLSHWDMAFWAERLREERFQFTDEELRPYFSFERVLEGLFSLSERIFGISVRAADGQAPIWHPDVRFFQVFDEPGEQIAAFYLDPYSRPADKRGGAWMDDCLGRRRINGQVQLPVAHLVCNQTPPSGGVPSLMSFREVETLFHEFGHGLQHMLTRIDDPEAAGINGVEWDAVELPSQFMENWCYHKPTLLGMTAHFQTGEPLPDELFEKIVAARTYRSGSQMLRQLQFGLTDLALHTEFDPQGSESPFDLMRRISEKTSILPLLPENRSLCSFQHIFSGGYAAGYYSYKWAEVLAADAFSAFEEAGLDQDEAVQTVGRRFRDTVLAQGGSRHPLEIFEEFRGRGPKPDALLQVSGLA